MSTSVAAAGVSDSAGCNTVPGWSSIIRNDAAAEEREVVARSCVDVSLHPLRCSARLRASIALPQAHARAEVDTNAAPCVLREARLQDGWQRPACFNANELVRH